MNFDEINNSLNAQSAREIEVTVVTLGGSEKRAVNAGTTIRDFKERYGLTDNRMVDSEGRLLTDSDILSSDMQVFVSTPKRNG